ncbi:MAG: TolC family protein, partial [Pseudomonadales bacterium]|nr:TolC family protein [Pseudomonadales bacterium]
RFDVGLVAITDVHESRAIYDLAKVSRLTNEGVVETSYEGLTVLTGRIYSQIQPLTKTIPITRPFPSERSAWLELAFRGNYDLKTARLTTEAAKYKSDSAKAKHYPTLSASLGHQVSITESSGADGFDSAFDGTNTTDAISIKLQVPIYFGGGISANRRKSYAEFDQARETLAAAERGITQQIRASHIAVLTSIQEVAARKQSITSAQSAVDAIQAGYNYGTRNIVDVLNAQRNLFSSQRDHANARYDYILRLLELKQAAGVLTPADIAGLNQWISAEMAPKQNPALMPPKPFNPANS